MNVLLDANVLLRLADPTSSAHTTAAAAILALRLQDHTLYVVPQCIYEFWAVATRPIANNGLGLSIAECIEEVVNIKSSFLLLNDRPELLAEWENIVRLFTCQGKVSHDARYFAAMRTHDLTHFLTFNIGDFTRFDGITLLDPGVVAGFKPATL